MAATKARTPVWDLPVRVTHWSIAGLTLGSWVTATSGWFVGHQACGYALLWLVLFRIYWGFQGGEAARFRHFLRGPRAVLGYARAFLSRNSHEPTLGHNPLGGWNVILMLAALLVQAGLGLFAVDEFGLQSGPLAVHLSFEQGRLAAAAHALLFKGLLLLIGLHLAAVCSHWFIKRENLVAPMLSGWKPVGSPARTILKPAPLGRAALGLAVSAAVVALVAFAL